MRDTLLIVFLKAPRPGEVKTRLAQSIGSDEACTAYRRLLDTLLQNLSQLDAVQLRFTPEDGCSEIEAWLHPGWSALPQGPGDLGARMERAFEEAFLAGHQRVVIIGSDCPEITVADIREAWVALETHDVVLGPAIDGGYWLIGMTRSHAELFWDMPWSTDSVLAETQLRCKASSLRVHLLRPLTDIDSAADWQAWLARRHRCD